MADTILYKKPIPDRFSGGWLSNFADIPTEGPFHYGDLCEVRGELYVYEEKWLPVKEANERIFAIQLGEHG